MLRAMDSSSGGQWAEIESMLVSFSSALGAGAVGEGDADDLLQMAELADLTDICGQGTRTARHARDLVGRFYQKSSESGSFFRDVRMTPSQFDEVVTVTECHLPRGRRGAEALPPAWRVFAVLFWLALGGRQRVIARAVDVATSTFAKFCTPVVQALCVNLPAPTWPGRDERSEQSTLLLLTGATRGAPGPPLMGDLGSDARGASSQAESPVSRALTIIPRNAIWDSAPGPGKLPGAPGVRQVP